MAKGIGKRIDEMYAFVAVHSDGDEGVVAMTGPDGAWLPMVGADMARMNNLRPFAQHIARVEGKAIRLLRFSTRETVETLVP